MSHQISTAAVEQLAAGEDTAMRIVNISDTANNTLAVSNQAQGASNQIQALTANLEIEIDKFDM